MLEQLFKAYPVLQELLKGEFNRGYVSAVVVMFFIAVFLLIIRIVLAVIFRVRRCRTLRISRPDGDIILSAEAVEQAFCQAIDSRSPLQLEQLRAFSVSKKYNFELICSYRAGSESLADAADALRKKLQEVFRSFFGLKNVGKINFRFESLPAPKELLRMETPQPVSFVPAEESDAAPEEKPLETYHPANEQ